MEKPASGVTAAMEEPRRRTAVASQHVEAAQKICGTAWVAVTLTALQGWAAGGVSGAHAGRNRPGAVQPDARRHREPALEPLSVLTWDSLPFR